MCDYLPRKVLREREFFERTVPELLPAWVRYAGQRRGIPKAAIEEATSAIDLFHGEMLSLVGDESAWGPSKTFLAAASEAGVDLADPAAIEAYVEQHNRDLAA